MNEYIDAIQGLAIFALISASISWLLIRWLTEEHGISIAQYALVCLIGVIWILVSHNIYQWAETHYIFNDEKAVTLLAVTFAFIWIYLPFYIRKTAQRFISMRINKYYSILFIPPVFVSLFIYTELM